MLVKFILRLIITALAILAIAELIPGIEVSSFYIALITAVLWGLISLTLRPLLTIITLPVNILTLGLFSFIINALLFWFLASFVAGFAVAGFLPALIGSALLSFVIWILHRFS